MTHSPFCWRNPLEKLREEQQLIPYSRQLNDILWWGNLLHVPIYCWPKKNDKQMSLLFPFSFYSEQLLLFHQPSFSTSCEWKVFCKLKVADRKGKCTSSSWFFLGAAGPPEGRAGRLVLLIFRCGSRTLWFWSPQTLCLPTLGWILSPWILSPRWACSTGLFLCILFDLVLFLL